MLDIKWNDKFSVGHERIDDEHQVFLGLVRNVSLAADHHFLKDRIVRLLEELWRQDLGRRANESLYD